MSEQVNQSENHGPILFKNTYFATEILSLANGLVTTIVKTKHMVRRNVVVRNVQPGKSPSGKCPVEKVSVEELPFREVSAWDLFMRKSQTGNFPDTNLSVKHSQRKCYKELSKKEQ